MYGYVANDPVNATDPTGQFLDILADVVFIVADIGTLAYDEIANGGANRTENLFALGADAAGFFVPFATGGGLAARASLRADDAAKAARSAICCFVAGTPVLTDQGLRPIEELGVDDLVLAKDVTTGEQSFKPIIDLIRRHGRVIWEVTVKGVNGEAETFRTTDDHPWWVGGSVWVATDKLQSGMAVEDEEGKSFTIAEVIKTEDREPTYNLTVADFETYYVGETGILVHNCSGAVGLARYDGPKPKYDVNPAHQKGQRGFHPGKTPLPSDAKDVYRGAVPSGDGTTGSVRQWWGVNGDGQLYRFSDSNNGTAHFTGTFEPNHKHVPQYVRDRLGL